VTNVNSATAVSGHGVTVGVPARWDVRIFRRGGGGVTAHLANFALPHKDGEFGTRATLTMPSNGLFIALTEYLPDKHLAVGRGLYSAVRPTLLQPGDFRTRALLHIRPGQTGLQRFFSETGRAFCLYVVASEAHVVDHAALATEIVDSLRVTSMSRQST
jgi:hypothetical protein